MYEMVTADSQRVAVTRSDENAQPRVGHLKAGSYRVSAAVYAMEPVCINIIREAGRAAYAGYYGELLVRYAFRFGYFG